MRTGVDAAAIYYKRHKKIKWLYLCSLFEISINEISSSKF